MKETYRFNSIDELIKEAAAPSVNQLIEKYVVKEKMCDEDTFMQLLFTDPTFDRHSGKVGSYTLWLIKMFKDKPELISEDSGKVREYLEIYDKVKLKGTTPQEYKRIENFASIPDLYKFIKSYRQDAETAKDVSSEVIYENDKWIVYAVDNQEDACTLGSNTGWCTAPEGSRHYEGYASTGRLYVFINKFDKNEKYQLHAGSNQFMDIDDSSVYPKAFIDELRKGNKSDIELSHEFNSIRDGAAEEYHEIYSHIKWEQFHQQFDLEANSEMMRIEGFEDFEPEIQSYLIRLAEEYLGDNLKTDSTDMYGRPEVYLYWDGFFEDIAEELPEIIQQQQHKIDERKMNEAGQGKLFEESGEEDEALNKVSKVIKGDIMKINSNTIGLERKSSEFSEIEDIVMKIAAVNGIKDVASVHIQLTADKGFVGFKIAEEAVAVTPTQEQANAVAAQPEAGADDATIINEAAAELAAKTQGKAPQQQEAVPQGTPAQ